MGKLNETIIKANLKLYSIAFFFCLAIFILDLLVPLGVVMGIIYILVLLFSYWFQDKRAIYILTPSVVFLIVIGYFLSPAGSDNWMVVANRLISVGTIICTSLLLIRIKTIDLKEKETNNKLREYYAKLEDTVSERTQELKEATASIKQQVDLLNVASIVSITDRNGIIIEVNDSFCEISGFSREELIGQNHRIIKSETHPDSLFKGMWATLNEGNTWRKEICNKRKDGTLYWVLTTIAPFMNSKNEIDKFVAVRFDITELKEYEKKLKNQAKLLQVSNNKLGYANKELEMFSYSVSHDLKAPLRALQGFSKNLVDKYGDSFDERGVRWLTFIKENAQRMDNLMQDMLTFSKLSRTEIVRTNIDTNKLISEVYEQEKKEINKPIVFSVEDLPVGYGDSTMIRMIWQNLIGNAIKYSSKEEKIVITVKGHQDETNSYYEISDNGVGFDMKYYDKIFGVFQRLHGNDEFEGTGVGLANVKRIVDKHGGEIKAESELNKGSKFKLTLPNK